MKLCKDCLYFKPEKPYPDGSPRPISMAECAHPHNISFEPVIGRTTFLVYPTRHRSAGWFEARTQNLCGREARWFQPKQATQVQ